MVITQDEERGCAVAVMHTAMGKPLLIVAMVVMGFACEVVMSDIVHQLRDQMITAGSELEDQKKDEEGAKTTHDYNLPSQLQITKSIAQYIR